MEIKESINNIHSSFEDIINNITLLKINLTEVQQKIRVVEKTIKKELKRINKIDKINDIKKNKKPSGFAKPSLVTNKLCDFMNRPLGTEIARTEVNKYLISYIKENNLQDETNKTVIIPDNKLKELLDIDDTSTTLTFFTIQKHMNKHFILNKDGIMLHTNCC